jgi:hypothetical protein
MSCEHNSNEVGKYFEGNKSKITWNELIAQVQRGQHNSNYMRTEFERNESIIGKRLQHNYLE